MLRHWYNQVIDDIICTTGGTRRRHLQLWWTPQTGNGAERSSNESGIRNQLSADPVLPRDVTLHSIKALEHSCLHLYLYVYIVWSCTTWMDNMSQIVVLFVLLLITVLSPTPQPLATIITPTSHTNPYLILYPHIYHLPFSNILIFKGINPT